MKTSYFYFSELMTTFPKSHMKLARFICSYNFDSIVVARGILLVNVCVITAVPGAAAAVASSGTEALPD